ncbi:O-antigen ligase family protein [Clostridium sp. HBUAS56010]|uniref:O-antigen ligase family protein n=1 Tax=Clostridium sp. HBUAS56010 TaxID=2571127 RepID=UPI001FAAB75A|nr:O-antigen ligase family protein [Clostridium sp. HBUAS56010]
MAELNKNSCGVHRSNSLVALFMRVYVIFIGVGLPLFVRNKYFDILISKYYFYCICTITMIIILVICVILQRYKIIQSVDKDLLNKAFENLTLTDYSVLAFYLITILSTITSDFVFESFWGNEGRFTGLFLITWYVLSYFCVSKFWEFKKNDINIIIAAGIFICLFGITDYFKLDIFKFKAPMVAGQRAIFTSTIGNINTYTAYVGIIVAISTVLFSLSKELKQSVIYYICMVISFFAIIMGVSDNAYLSLASLFCLLPFILFSSKNGMRKYLIIITTFFTVIQCIDWINLFMGDRVLGIDSAFNMVIGFSGLHYIVIALWAAICIEKAIDTKFGNRDKVYGNTFKCIWIFVMVAVLLGILYIYYDINILGNSTKYGGLSAYFVFNDDWGTHRGYIWRNAMERFSGLSIFKKIIGFGPETFGIFILQRTANNPYKELFDSAHNEYLHLLITVGVAGLTSYLVFIISNILDTLKHNRNNSYILAIAFAVISYSIQAVVNLNLPITTPVFWLLLGIMAAKKTRYTSKSIEE